MALDPSSPQAVPDQVARTSSDGFSSTARAAFGSPVSVMTAALKPRSVLIATDFSEAFETPLRHSLLLANIMGVHDSSRRGGISRVNSTTRL